MHTLSLRRAPVGKVGVDVTMMLITSVLSPEKKVTTNSKKFQYCFNARFEAEADAERSLPAVTWSGLGIIWRAT